MLSGLNDQERATVLADALPWLQHYRDAIVVVKYGGNAMVDERLKAAFAADMVFLRTVGAKPVVVHGGGPQINSMLHRLGIEGEFKGGFRVTSSEIMDVVRMVLFGQVGRGLVNLINSHGPYAVGGLWRGRRPLPRDETAGRCRWRAYRYRNGGRYRRGQSSSRNGHH